jgi:glycosyltransferase involved in cell wall biosynthesis
MKLSIITINYNNIKGLEKTIKSVVNQTYTDFEYIIIDGGSSDGSIDIIKQHENKISYWVSEPDKGIYNAMNKGIKKATGEYLLFLNSGDWLIDNKVLAKNSDLFNATEIIYFNTYYVSDVKKKLVAHPDFLSFYFFFTHTVCQQAVFFKSTLFQQFGLFDESMKIASDWEFLMRVIIKHEVSYTHINDSFSYCEDGGFSGQNLKLLEEERDHILKTQYPAFYADYTEYQLLKLYFKKFKLNAIKKCLIHFKNIFKGK